MSYRVHVSEPAEEDADRVYTWIRERSPDGASRWWNVLLAALEKLKDQAASFALAPEADDFEEPLRQILFRTRRGRTYRVSLSFVMTWSMSFAFGLPGKTLSVRTTLRFLLLKRGLMYPVAGCNALAAQPSGQSYLT